MLRKALFAALLLAAPACASDVIDPNAFYPEGPLFSGDALYVAEMGADRVSAYAGGKKSVFFSEKGCGPTALAPYRGGYLILCHLAGEVLAVADGKIVARFGKDVLRDPNDGFAGLKGDVYFSDPGLFSKASKPTGKVYRLSAEGALSVAAEGLWYPNGVFVDAQERALYLSETFARKVWRYRIGEDGTLSGKTLFADIGANTGAYREAGPDGLERAADGTLSVAIYGEGRVLHFDRAGKLAGTTTVPTPYVTNIAYGPAGAVVVGAFVNDRPPFRGEVRWMRR